MGYASISDLTTYGLPTTALGQLTTAQQQAALDSASSTIDSYLRGRYALPLLAWGNELNEWAAIIAAYKLVMGVRGGNPATNDRALKDRYDRAMFELAEVQRQARHPNVTPQPSQVPTYNAPQVWSSTTKSVGPGSSPSATPTQQTSGGNRRW